MGEHVKVWLLKHGPFLGQCALVILIFWIYESAHQKRLGKLEAQVESLTEWAMDQ